MTNRLANREWLYKANTEQWRSRRGYDGVTQFFCLIGLLPVICFSILLTIVLIHIESSHDDTTNTGTDDTLPPLRTPTPSSPIERPPTVITVQPRPPMPPMPGAVDIPPYGRYNGTVCTSYLCRFVGQWLRNKLNPTVDPCQDFYGYVCSTFQGTNQFMQSQYAIQMTTTSYAEDTNVPPANQTSWQKAAGLFQACVRLANSSRTETGDLVEWMISMNLDLANATKLGAVDAVDTIVRFSIDVGIDVILSITFSEKTFYNNKRTMQLDYSKEQEEWLEKRQSIDERTNEDFYVHLLHLFGVDAFVQLELAAEIIQYEKELIFVVNVTKSLQAPHKLRTIRGLGELTEPHINGSQWADAFSKYTNKMYSGEDFIVYRYYVLDILLSTIEHRLIGYRGLRYLIAWSVFRQMVNYTVPRLLVNNTRAHRACYNHVLKAMKLAVVSPFLQSKNFPDVPFDRFFNPWRKALAMSCHKTWSDQTTWLYDESIMNAHYVSFLNAVVVPTAILYRPFFFYDSPPALNYGGIGAIIAHEIMHMYDVNGIMIDDDGQYRHWPTPEFTAEYTERAICVRQAHKALRKQRARQGKVDEILDSENLADFVGIRASYAAFRSLHPSDRLKTLLGLNITADRLFFINFCVKHCFQHETTDTVRYSPFDVRCLVPLMHMPEFSATFGCAPGTPMNPQKKCTFW